MEPREAGKGATVTTPRCRKGVGPMGWCSGSWDNLGRVS